jgi:hypothetical protein
MYQSSALPACMKFKWKKFPKTLIAQNMAIYLRGRVTETGKNENVYSFSKCFLDDFTSHFDIHLLQIYIL